MNMTLKFGMIIRYEKFNSFLSFHSDSNGSILIQNEIFYSDVKDFISRVVIYRLSNSSDTRQKYFFFIYAIVF